MEYMVKISTDGNEIVFKNKEFCDALQFAEDAAQSVEGFDDGDTVISLYVKKYAPASAT
jgi:hypothetical protein